MVDRRRPACCSRPRSTSRRPPTSPTTSARLLDAGIDDWGGVSPVTADHVNPERAWPALDLPARRHRGRRAHAGAPADRLSRVRPRPRPLARPGHALRGARPSDAEGLARRRRLVLGRRRPPPPSCWRAVRPEVRRRGRRLRPSGGVAEVLAGVGLGQEVGRGRDRDPVLGARGPRSAAWPRWPTSCGPRSSATPSPGSSTATSTTPTCARSSAGSAPSPRGRCRSTSGARPICSSWTTSPAGCAEAEALGATEVCLQGGIHPKFDGDYYIDVIRAVRAASEHPHPRLHRARGDRGGPPAGGAAGRVPACA